MAWAEKLPSGRFRGVYRDPAKRRHSVSGEDGKGFEKKRDAKAAAVEEEVKAKRSASRRAPAASMTWGQWWERISPERDKPETDTFRNEQSMVRNHLDPWWGETALNLITNADVQRWVNDPQGLKPLAPSSVHRIYGLFATTIRKAVRDGMLDASPCVGVVLPRIPKQTLPVLREGDSKDLDRQDYQDALDFLLETGIRPGELCGLHVESIGIPSEGWMMVKHVRVQDRKVIRPWPKDLDERPVPLTPKALEIIARRIENRDLSGPCGVEHIGARCKSALVFLTEKQQPMTPRGFNRYLTRRKMTAPYGGRRGFITRSSAGGFAPFDAAFVAGHSDVGRTQGYWQVDEALRQRLIAALGQHEGLSIVTPEETRGASQGAKPRNTPTHDDSRESGESTG